MHAVFILRIITASTTELITEKCKRIMNISIQNDEKKFLSNYILKKI